MNQKREILIFDKEPLGFSPKVAVVAAHVVSGGKILLLEGGDGKPQTGFFTPPAGKMEAGETPLQALKRELFEETAIFLPDDFSPRYLFSLYIRKPEIDYLYHCFELFFIKTPPVTLSSEHRSYRWESPEEGRKLPLIEGGNVILEKYLHCSHALNPSR